MPAPDPAAPSGPGRDARPGTDLAAAHTERLGKEHSKQLSERIGEQQGGGLPAPASPAAVRLIVQEGPDRGKEFALTERLVTIGRGPDNTVFLPDPTVSKRHARIVRAENEFELEDAGSRNGTRLNGKPVKHQSLQDGDLVQIGTTTLRFERANT